MDFSEVRRTGSYVLEGGGPATVRFEPDVWRGPQGAELPHAERCGKGYIPGIHSVPPLRLDRRARRQAHRHQWRWHDAGDLTQDLLRHEIRPRMVADAVRAHDPELLARVLEEARWGLDGS